MTHVHVIGAGLAGLSAAVALAGAGTAVTLSEAAAQAGGRCRSYFDAQLGLTIDNGSHLVLSGNRAVADYLGLIGAGDRLIGPDSADFHFVDVGSGARWQLRPNDGRLAWWVLAPGRRVPGTSAGDYLPLARLLRPQGEATLGEVLGDRGPLWHNLLEPFFDGDTVTGLDFGDGPERVHPGDQVVLAVPPWIAADLMPGLDVPTRFHAIVNGHFRVAPPPGTPLMQGVIGGMAEWIFAFPDRIAVTVSAADALAAEPREAIAGKLWADVARVLGLPPELPPWQIVKEQRATFAATPEQDALRPGAETALANLVLAGDWTQTGLPATIEGAVRSGQHAAALALGKIGQPRLNRAA